MLTEKEELLAFLALAGDGPIPHGTKTHDCIFMGVAENAALLEHPLGKFLQQNKLEEFVCTSNDMGNKLEITITMPDAKVMVTFANEPFGRWYYVNGDYRSEEGLCAFAEGNL